MKRLILASALAAAFAGPAHAAGSANQPFDVTINLTAACAITVPSVVTFNYTALQSSPAVSTGGAFNVTCSSGLAYTFGLTVAPGPAAPPGLAQISVVDSVLNLTYTIDVPAGGSGSGAAQAKALVGGITAGQVGNCSSTCDNSLATNRTHYLIVNY